MPLVPALPPQPVPIYSGFDYVTTDSARHRVYAAHTGSQALLIVDSDSQKVLGQVRVGPLHGIAVNPANGHVFTGDGAARTVSEVDPETKQVLRSADVDGEVDAIAYDPALHRIYADEDDGTRIFIVDTATFKEVGTVKLPGHKPEYLAIDSKTHDVYQNIANLNEFVVVDAQTLAVKKTVPTPEITGNHPLQLDSARGRVYVGGQNSVLSVYDTSGKKLATLSVQKAIDQCDLDAAHHRLACAGSGELTLIDDSPGKDPSVLARSPVSSHAHTVAIDGNTQLMWLVWAADDGDFVQPLQYKPGP